VFGRAAPCTCRSNGNVNVKNLHSVGWRGGSGCGGRREYVPVGSVAPSMALTPPQPDPPRLRQISAMCRSGVLCCCWVSTLVDTVDPRHAWMGRSWGCVTRHFTGVGFLAYGCNRSGAALQQIYVSTDTPPASEPARRCMARTLRHKETVGGVGGSGCGGVSAMDGATELTWTYLQRPPHPDPPAHRAGGQLLPLLRPLLRPLPLRVPGGSPATTPP